MASPPSTAPAADPGDAGWTTEIRPQTGWMDWRLGELWRCRDLIALFVWRDFVSVYKQTVLGPLWHLIQPLLTTITFTVIFGRVAGLPTDGAPPFLFYMAGNIVWVYFSGCLTKTANTFVGNAALLGKVYFHRLAIPVSVALSSLISFAIQFAVFGVCLGWYMLQGFRIPLTADAFLAPVWILMLAGFGLGGGIIASALTTRYRDLSHLIAFGMQLFMYASPVIYSTSAVPPKYRWIVEINPLSPVIEAFRHGFVGGAPVPLGQLGYSLACLVVLLFGGLILFSRVERTFMDTV